MNAYDQLERQLRASVAQAPEHRRLLPRGPRWSRGLSAVLLVASSAVALSVAVVAVVALRHGRPAPSARSAPATTHHRDGIGPPPKEPGPIPRGVDDGAVAASWNTAWGEDPVCRPGSGTRVRTRTSEGRPDAATLSELAVLRRPATSADRLPARLYANGRLRPLLFQGSEVYVRYIRRARVADGSSYYVIPVAKLGQPALSPAAARRCYRLTVAALHAKLPAVPASERAATRRYGDAEFAVGRYNLETSSVHEGVFLLTQSFNGSTGVSGGQSPAMIRQTGLLGGGSGGTPPSPIVMDGIVPTGVLTVTLHFPATRHGRRHLPALNATGHVINNVFIIPIPTLFQRGAWPTTAIWRSSAGKPTRIINERPFHP